MSFPTRTFPYKVIYADTDAGGVVYYANYLRLFEYARALYVEAAGFTLPELEERNCLFVCRRAEADYLLSAKLGDALDIETRVEAGGKAFLDFTYTITRINKDGEREEIARGYTKMVCTALKNGRLAPQRMPAWLLEQMQSQS
ncbi:MAG: thioesterase family protein [Candidatus Hinthialibacter antarcticus]|nr:thioesterase family protein [Candidatus Hinthialibacter antarcticus]